MRRIISREIILGEDNKWMRVERWEKTWIDCLLKMQIIHNNLFNIFLEKHIAKAFLP